MTYDEDGNFDAAYTYGLERIEIEALDDTRPESQDPLYYLYDGLGSVTFMVKPDGNKRDHYRYDEFGKPAPGNSKLSEDGRNVLHNTLAIPVRCGIRRVNCYTCGHGIMSRRRGGS